MSTFWYANIFALIAYSYINTSSGRRVFCCIWGQFLQENGPYGALTRFFRVEITEVML